MSEECVFSAAVSDSDDAWAAALGHVTTIWSHIFSPQWFISRTC